MINVTEPKAQPVNQAGGTAPVATPTINRPNPVSVPTKAVNRPNAPVQNFDNVAENGENGAVQVPQKTGTVAAHKRQEKEDRMAVIYYIAGRANSVTEHVIPDTEASKLYKKLYADEMAKPEDQRMKTEMAKTNKKTGKKTGEPIHLTETYNQERLRHFFNDTYKSLYDKNYVKVVISESRPEFFGIKSLLRQKAAEITDFALSSFNGNLAEKAAYVDEANDVYVVKRKDLVAIMIATDAKEIPILVKSNDVTQPDGYIITKPKTKKAKKTEEAATAAKPAKTRKPNPLSLVDLRYLSRSERGKIEEVKTLLEMGVPYAVNRDITENPGCITDTSKIVNIEQVKKLFGENYPFETLGTTIELKTDNYANADLYKAAVAATYIQPSETGLGKRFQEIGLTDEALKEIRSKKTRTRSTVSVDQLYKENLQVLFEVSSLLKAQ